MAKHTTGVGRVLEHLLEVTSLLSEGMEDDASGRGLTVARAGVVWVLHKEGPQRQRDLAEALRVSPCNITGLVDGLEATGFVVREPHPHDRRATVVRLTELGTAVADALTAEKDDFARFLFEGVSSVDLTSLVGILQRVLDRLRSSAYIRARERALERWAERRAEIEESLVTAKPRISQMSSR
ncbi:MAG: MarR family transcriptional regulator [Candidatus Dormibacteraeota bacterium]|nr:MarR family transcriptional regulator [Candidatus Dormibacteraeota bacterium]